MVTPPRSAIGAANRPHPPYWIQGLKPKGLTAPMDLEWYRRIVLIISRDFTQIERDPDTIMAETGLDIPPSIYFFVSTAVKEFSNGIFIYTVVGNSELSSYGSASPFDTGGLWHDHIHTDPELATNQSKRDFFKRYNFTLSQWRQAFRDFIATNHNSFDAYVDGHPPRPSFTKPIRIITGLPNTVRAWIWEGRLTLPPSSDAFHLHKFVCQPDKLGNLKSRLQSLRKQRLVTKRTVGEVMKWTNSDANLIILDLNESPHERTQEFLKSQGI